MYRADFRFQFFWSCVTCTVDTALHHTETYECVSDTLCRKKKKKLCQRKLVMIYALSVWIDRVWNTSQLLVEARTNLHHTVAERTYHSHSTQFLKARTIPTVRSFWRHVPFPQYAVAEGTYHSHNTQFLKARAIPSVRSCWRHVP
jgi:hypothetical protein